MNNLRNFLRALACALLVSAIPSGLAYAGDDDDGDRHHGDNHFKIDVLSSRPYMVSGGDALVRVTVKKNKVNLGSVRIELNGANVTGAFRADAGDDGDTPDPPAGHAAAAPPRGGQVSTPENRSLPVLREDGPAEGGDDRLFLVAPQLGGDRQVDHRTGIMPRCGRRTKRVRQLAYSDRDINPIGQQRHPGHDAAQQPLHLLGWDPDPTLAEFRCAYERAM